MGPSNDLARTENGRARELRASANRTGGYVGYAMLAVDYIDALHRRKLMVADLERAVGAYDAIASPTLPTVTYPIGVRFDDAYPRYPGVASLIAPGNLTGAPAIGVPNGFGDGGLPTGFSLLAGPFAEASHHATRPTVAVDLDENAPKRKVRASG